MTSWEPYEPKKIEDMSNGWYWVVIPNCEKQSRYIIMQFDIERVRIDQEAGCKFFRMMQRDEWLAKIEECKRLRALPITDRDPSDSHDWLDNRIKDLQSAIFEYDLKIRKAIELKRSMVPYKR